LQNASRNLSSSAQVFAQYVQLKARQEELEQKKELEQQMKAKDEQLQEQARALQCRQSQGHKVFLVSLLVSRPSAISLYFVSRVTPATLV
jgi:hypothetical protein